MYSHSFADFFSLDHYAVVKPTPVRDPKLIAWSEDAAKLVSLQKSTELTEVLAGNRILPEMKPIATRYGGHQFGHWAGQLGDGRAIILGEKEGYEIQLKGAGLTPYSRRGDGRAVLRSSLREYLCSEAMHYLGIPTTRALALVSTGDQVVRDMFYDGHPAPEPGAICTRLAPTFIRFGHFEILAADRNKKDLQRLLDYTLRFYPGHNLNSFFAELCQRTARLIVEWLRVGFVHGVMNTDNMSILGLTIDYGPYGWLDVYNPGWTPNTTDSQEYRYAFGEQPQIAFWNLYMLAEALTLLDVDLSTELETYKTTFFAAWKKMMTAKLGLNNFNSTLVRSLDELLQQQETDMTLFYRELAKLTEGGQLPQEIFYQELSSENTPRWSEWLAQWRSEIKSNSSAQSRARMNEVNPAFILRNYLVQEAIDGLMSNNDSKLRTLEKAIKSPYSLDYPQFYSKRPEWARTKPGCSALSCSS